MFSEIHPKMKKIESSSSSSSSSSEISSIKKDSSLKTSRLDPITLHRLKSAQRAYYKRRMVYSSIGVLCGMVGLYLTAIQVPLSPPEIPVTEKTSSSTTTTTTTVNHLESNKHVAKDHDLIMSLAQDRKVIITQRNTNYESEERDDFVKTGNSVVPEFPRVLKLKNSGSSASDFTEYHLLGHGIRTVSFLKIQVYVVGIYIAADDITTIQNNLIKRIDPLATTLVVDEKVKLGNMLRDPEQSEHIWNSILEDSSCRTLIRIVPTRNTDFGHLRDAWVRSMTSRAQKVGWNDEKFGESVTEFKRIFARGNVPKGTELLLSRGRQGNLEVWCDWEKGKEKLGELFDERVSRAVWLGYLAGKGVACEGAREGVVAGLLKFVERPFGSGIR